MLSVVWVHAAHKVSLILSPDRHIWKYEVDETFSSTFVIPCIQLKL